MQWRDDDDDDADAPVTPPRRPASPATPVTVRRVGATVGKPATVEDCPEDDEDGGGVPRY